MTDTPDDTIPPESHPQSLSSRSLTAVRSHPFITTIMVVMHGLHAVGALILLAWGYIRLLGGTLTPSLFGAGQVFWYFVVALWPILYWLVYR